LDEYRNYKIDQVREGNFPNEVVSDIRSSDVY